jgi:hypothetical protein
MRHATDTKAPNSIGIHRASSSSTSRTEVESGLEPYREYDLHDWCAGAERPLDAMPHYVFAITRIENDQFTNFSKQHNPENIYNSRHQLSNQLTLVHHLQPHTTATGAASVTIHANNPLITTTLVRIFMVLVSFTCGNFSFGTSFPRNLHKGSHPSVGSHFKTSLLCSLAKRITISLCLSCSLTSNIPTPQKLGALSIAAL